MCIRDRAEAVLNEATAKAKSVYEKALTLANDQFKAATNASSEKASQAREAAKKAEEAMKNHRLHSIFAQPQSGGRTRV